jgi:hypothetical protein
MAGQGSGQGSPPPGWYPDPDRPGNRRWWDGLAWTDFSEPADAPGGTGPPKADAPGVTVPPSAGTPPGSSATGASGWASSGPAGPAPRIDTWLWQSIVVTVLCCLPLGIVGIVFSSQAQTEISNHNYAAAQEKARQAKTFTLVGAGIGLAMYVGGFALLWLPFMFAI